ncbi:PREDICTED: serine beta-lactamase-like protein LACTB, mitochondrial isoform X1 [Cercocebus atys]|uniref:Serine beta-lactamase-like protein LACTB, mitochondrial n=2 Tax=Cercopithecinae TaxID=9528 RepID=F7EXQ6_MACMU|nr:serine beta-lactamase-like protein LACTB, mitochondrial isoform X1 [Macaca mulatta]XP_011948236.1 PREDICTED: serine beta-lactamase-like protein LACTB, mitochondrial isoform X1 [Cercocebus atys]
MYRLLSAVTVRAAAPGGLASSCGRRGVHQRAGLPPLGHGWVGGLGLGLGLALGVKLAGGLRGAAPAQSPAAPDPEASPLAEPPQAQSLAPWSPQTPAPPHSRGFARAIESSRDLLHRIKDEVGAPGIVVGVSVDGKEVWSEGLGYADVENRVPCKPETVMRIASISKSLTMVALAKLWEAGKLDLDIPVQHYVPEFPEKEYEGEKVSVTTRLLISHLSGIRHYEKDIKKVKEEKAYKALKMMKETVAFEQEKEGKSNEKNDFTKFKTEQENEAKSRNSKPGKKKNDFEQGELYLREKFENSIESLRLFKNDPLFFKPGSQFLYSTFGYTLLAAIVERASGYKYLDYMQKIFQDLDMLTTVQEENEPVIYNRARFYVYNKKKRLVNTPYVDNSYKWAGGGFLSTVGDLLKFGNAMLYGYQVGLFKNSNENLLPGYLKPETMVMMWTPVPNTEMSWDKEGKYAMAWGVVEKKQTYGSCRKQRHYASHTGGAVGASSVLLVLPEELDTETINNKVPPRGIIVSIICNMQSVGLNSTALKIALEFDKDRSD